MSGAVGLAEERVGDIWEYDERCAVNQEYKRLLGQRREVVSVGEVVVTRMPGGLITIDHMRGWLPKFARLISRAGQPVTAEHDRSGCKAFCGHLNDSEQYRAVAGCIGVFFPPVPPDAPGGRNRWCSARCRDLRLPPIDSNRLPVAEARGADDTRRSTPSSTPLTAVRDAHGTSTPARVEAQPGGSRNEGQTIASLTAGSASPANVPPVPAVGQRWHIRSRSLSADNGIFVIEKVDERGFFPLVGHYEESGEPDSWGASIYVVADLLPPTTRHPAGITCRRCLVTSEHGDIHMETCTARDFAEADRDLTSEEWSAQVHYELLRLEGEREDAARPFVTDISDEELFGRAVKP